MSRSCSCSSRSRLAVEATGTMSAEFRQALTERRDLIEARADAILDTALNEHHGWATASGVAPKQGRDAAAWRQAARIVAAYRDRYGITGPHPLGVPAESDVQKVDAARARAALERARNLADAERQPQEPASRTGSTRVGPTL